MNPLRSNAASPGVPAGKAVSLPVLSGGVRGRRRRVAAPLRTGVLIAVHLLMAAHVLHWWITGRSIGRFVLSDSMKTLELGEVNPGFVLFCAATLVTAVAGRWMCGWVCHMGALQDLAAWVLRRLGIRPRLFRSRVLGFVPVALAIYMFAWPTLKREAGWAAPREDAAPPSRLAGFPGFSLDLKTDRLWDGLPSWGVGAPFILLCGAGTVYFLGARGLCRYGCPYGGVLLPVERLAIARVVVDPDRCNQCGLCTAACTAGVRVHDQVRVYGAVMDPHCIRSLDCIEACPSDALRLGVSRPGIFRAGRAGAEKAKYDLGWAEELACLGAFLSVFFVSRGLYEMIPMLLAATLGVLGAFLAWKCIRVVKDRNVRLGAVQLRLKGRLTRGGRGFLAACVVLVALVAHSALVKGLVYAAERRDDLVLAPFEDVVRGGPIPPDQREAAGRAYRLYAAARPVREGGLALARTPRTEVRRAWMLAVIEGVDAAERELGEAAVENPVAAAQLANLLDARGKAEECRRELEKAVERHPGDTQLRDMLANVWVREGLGEQAAGMYRRLLERRPGAAELEIGLGRVLVLTGHAEEGLERMRRVGEEWPGHAEQRREYALALFWTGRADDALAELADAARKKPAAAEGLNALARELAARAGRSRE